ncbi:MAG: acyltransferase [Prevotella sp.]
MFGSWGESSVISYRAYRLQGLKNVFVGTNSRIGRSVQLTAWERAYGQTHTPCITIGDFCCIRDYAHITAINSITIGNNVLTGNNVLITDNSHGEIKFEQMGIRPEIRPLYSKGPVKIEDNVWLGNNVCVMPNVTIGQGSIIGANAVVVHDIPPFSVAVGVPAKVVKTLKAEKK